MTKREYFEKRLVDVTSEGWNYELFPITEQDIVKPYLDKIKSYTDHLRNCGMGKSKSLNFMDKFVDGLLSEKGDTDGK